MAGNNSNKIITTLEDYQQKSFRDNIFYFQSISLCKLEFPNLVFSEEPVNF